MNRRDILRGGIAFSVSAPAAIGMVAHDPLLSAIRDYRRGVAAFNAVPVGTITFENEEDIVNATYGPLMDALADWKDPATTRDGAIEALRFMMEQYPIDDAFGNPMCRAALGYLESLPA